MSYLSVGTEPRTVILILSTIYFTIDECEHPVPQTTVRTGLVMTGQTPLSGSKWDMNDHSSGCKQEEDRVHVKREIVPLGTERNSDKMLDFLNVPGE
mmetsp:Transcript_21906/g.51661  ORF Transcript_21906/g.51661 Transcript_21906/m.51661 type:complete len:97 (-) Transcript_21906:772-1062(-)